LVVPCKIYVVLNDHMRSYTPSSLRILLSHQHISRPPASRRWRGSKRVTCSGPHLRCCIHRRESQAASQSLRSI